MKSRAEIIANLTRVAQEAKARREKEAEQRNQAMAAKDQPIVDRRRRPASWQLHAILESKRGQVPEYVYKAAKGTGTEGAGGSNRP